MDNGNPIVGSAGQPTASSVSHSTPSVDTSQCYSGLDHFAYTVNAVGNRTQVVDNSGTTTYGYDNLYRLTSVTYPGPTTDTYTYDAVGNRLTKNATTHSYDNADQLTSTGGVSYGYDNNGNQTSRGSDSFAWDHENRMTSATVGGTQTTYSYNGDGLRQSRTAGGVTTSYTWDVAGGLPMLLQDGTNTYVYGLGLVSMTDSSGNQTYPLKDGLGSTVALANGSGTVTGTYAYDVFGAVRSHTGASTEFSFTGEQNDPNGLEYLRARYYDNATGRFMSGDPLGSGYGYAGANPVNRVDPSGLYAICGDDPVWGYICFDSTQVNLGLCDANGSCYLYQGDGNAPGNNLYADECSELMNYCHLPDGRMYVAYKGEDDGVASFLGYDKAHRDRFYSSAVACNPICVSFDSKLAKQTLACWVEQGEFLLGGEVIGIYRKLGGTFPKIFEQLQNIADWNDVIDKCWTDYWNTVQDR